MNVLLINPYDPQVRGVTGSLHPPAGLLYIAAVLEADGHLVKVVDANVMRLAPEGVVRAYVDPEVEVVGISVTAYQHRAALKISALLRNSPQEVKLLVGGAMPSSLPSFWARHADYVVVGEGEDAARGILRRLRAGERDVDLPNVVQGSTVPALRPESRKPSKVTTNLDSVPYPAYHLMIPTLSSFVLKTRTFKPLASPLFTSRGCRCHCSFCDRSISGATQRLRQPEDVVNEVMWLRDEYGVHQVDIEDDSFAANRAHCVEVLRRKAREAPEVLVNCDGGLRADDVDRVLVRELAQAQCVKVGIGVESGTPKVLNMNRKHVPLGRLAEVVEWFREEDILVHAFFILGLPGDTPETMARTIEFAKRLNPHFANFSIATPFPGTPLLDDIRANGNLLVNPEEGLLHGYSAGVPLFEYPGLSAADVSEAFRRAFRRFYCRPAKVIEYFLSSKSVYDLYWRLSVATGVVRSA